MAQSNTTYHLVHVLPEYDMVRIHQLRKQSLFDDDEVTPSSAAMHLPKLLSSKLPSAILPAQPRPEAYVVVFSRYEQ